MRNAFIAINKFVKYKCADLLIVFVVRFVINTKKTIRQISIDFDVCCPW